MTTSANEKNCEAEHAMGDWVNLKLRPYRNTSLFPHTHPKLAPRYVGLFPILTKVGKVAYCLALPVGAGIHLVFHVSVLRKAEGTNLPNMGADLLLIYSRLRCWA